MKFQNCHYCALIKHLILKAKQLLCVSLSKCTQEEIIFTQLVGDLFGVKHLAESVYALRKNLNTL